MWLLFFILYQLDVPPAIDLTIFSNCCQVLEHSCVCAVCLMHNMHFYIYMYNEYALLRSPIEVGPSVQCQFVKQRRHLNGMSQKASAVLQIDGVKRIAWWNRLERCDPLHEQNIISIDFCGLSEFAGKLSTQKWSCVQYIGIVHCM